MSNNLIWALGLIAVGVITLLLAFYPRKKTKSDHYSEAVLKGMEKGLLSVNNTRADLPKYEDCLEPYRYPPSEKDLKKLAKFEDWDLDYNRVAVPEFKSWCGHHSYKLDSIQMSENPDEDALMFSCRNTPCTATSVIDRGVFWKGRADREAYVNPEWLENYMAQIYNENMRAFERAAKKTTLYIPSTN